MSFNNHYLYFFKRVILITAAMLFVGMSMGVAQTPPVANPGDISIHPLSPSRTGGTEGTGKPVFVTPSTPGTQGTPGTGVTPGTTGTPGTQGTMGPALNINFNPGEQGDVGIAIQIVFAMTLLTLAPSMIIMMTCFTRIVIVLGFIKTAVGVQGVPSQLIAGIALFLTFYIMGPIFEDIYEDAVVPYMEEQIMSKQALEIAGGHMKNFMLSQTEPRNIDFFLGLGNFGPMTADEVPLRVVVPSFIMSELRTAFTMGFLIFVPFLVIDFIAASVLMSMGMMMMPPIIVSAPFKILLFVLVDGWYLIINSLVRSF